MGILRTDKISGLETPTPVTGSVEFDGTGKAVSFPAGSDFAYGTGDFTIEGWFYTTVIGQVSGASASSHIFFAQTVSGTNYLLFGVDDNGKLLYYSTASGGGSDRFSSAPDGSVVLNQWQHIALCRSSGTTKAFVDGKEIISISDTFDFDNTDRNPTIGNYTHTFDTQPFNGYVSNFRILKGTALYTSDFTVPTHELEVIGDTVLLCCNNSDSAGAESTTKNSTVSGSAPASTFSPGLTRDFTSGTEFRGVTTFDTQGYFVPPSGTTEQRNLSGTRGLFAGSNPQPADGGGNTIEFITVSTTGNSQDFGDRIGKGRRQIAAMSSHTRGVFGGSYGPSSTMGDTIDFVTIASTGNAIDFGDCLSDLTEATGISNNTRGIMAGGRTPTVHNVIQYITIPSLGNAADFGDLLDTTRNSASCQSSTRGLIGGGRTPTNLNVIQYVTIASTGNSIDFGDLTYGGGQGAMGGSNSIRGLFSGGFSPAASDAIEYVTIATTGNGQDFGDNTNATTNMNTMATSPTRACMFGANEPARTLSYVEIASTGNAQNFGSLYTDPTSNYSSGCSNGHGGLS
tara:strand:- start:708 stop:2414 length:1707 start_codon:yes stop_codon:yes gene_type:complete